MRLIMYLYSTRVHKCWHNYFYFCVYTFDSPRGFCISGNTEIKRRKRKRKRCAVWWDTTESFLVETKGAFVSWRVNMFAGQSWTTDKSRISILGDGVYSQVQINNAIRDCTRPPQPGARPCMNSAGAEGFPWSQNHILTLGASKIPQAPQDRETRLSESTLKMVI